MAIEVITKFVNKTTVRVIAHIKNDAGALTNISSPGSIKVTITDKEGTPVATAEDMELKTDPGIYEYPQQTTADYVKGEYRGEVWVVEGEGAGETTSSGFFSFTLT